MLLRCTMYQYSYFSSSTSRQKIRDVSPMSNTRIRKKNTFVIILISRLSLLIQKQTESHRRGQIVDRNNFFPSRTNTKATFHIVVRATGASQKGLPVQFRTTILHYGVHTYATLRSVTLPPTHGHAHTHTGREAAHQEGRAQTSQAPQPRSSYPRA